MSTITTCRDAGYVRTLRNRLGEKEGQRHPTLRDKRLTLSPKNDAARIGSGPREGNDGPGIAMKDVFQPCKHDASEDTMPGSSECV